MRKTINLYLVAIILLTSFSSFHHRGIVEVKKEVNKCACYFGFTVTSTTPIQFAELVDPFGNSYTNSNFTNWSDGSITNPGYSGEITIDFPPNNPSGTLTIKQNMVVVKSWSVPANTSQIYLYGHPPGGNAAAFCGVYEIEFN